MVNYRSFWALALLLASSCGAGVGGGGGRGGTGGATGGTGGALCIPGASVSCTCTSGRQGAQVCNADGKSLAACVCSETVVTAAPGAGGRSGAGGTGGGATDTGGTGAPCQGSLPPEIRFGAIGQGDVNPSFQSGVGALGSNVMYIFSGFTSPRERRRQREPGRVRAGVRPHHSPPAKGRRSPFSRRRPWASKARATWAAPSICSPRPSRTPATSRSPTS